VISPISRRASAQKGGGVGLFGRHDVDQVVGAGGQLVALGLAVPMSMSR
jgi:hypothetical protein